MRFRSIAHVAWFGIGRTDRAIADFRAAIAEAPEAHLAHYNLGICLGSSGDYAQASEVFRTASRILPDHPRTRYHLALALSAADRPAEAREQSEYLGRLDPTLAAALKAIIGY